MSIDKLRDEVGTAAERSLRRYRRRGEASFSRLGARIALAGGAYVATLVLIYGAALLGSHFVAFLRDGTFEDAELVTVFVVGVIAFFYGSLAGIAYAGIVSVPTLALIGGGLRLLRWRPREDRFGVFCGGLVACLAMLPVSLSIEPTVPFRSSGEVLILWLIGPAAAVLFGMVGGAVGGTENELARRRRRGARESDRPSPPRFKVAQLMVVMTIVSLLLTGLKAAGLLTMPMLLATIAWLAVQVLAHKPALRFARWWVTGQQRRMRRELAERRDRVRRRLRAEAGVGRST